MNEHLKIAEARHFLQRFSKAEPTPQEFKFEVSAFLSSSRSALQYALDEAKTRAGGQIWFDNHARAPDVRYLKEKRDTNIHHEPVIPQVGLMFSDSLSVSIPLLLSGTLTDINGNSSLPVPTQNEPTTHTATHALASTSTSTSTSASASASITYRFNDWPGPEDVHTLCERYLVQIEAIVAEGQSMGFLTPPAA
jgi:hypothetical protein